MRIANIIMGYKDPSQIERMIKAMNHPDCFFFIHIDKKIRLEPFLSLKDIDRVIFIENRLLCNWGGFSFVKAVINALEEILNSHASFDYYNLMSGQDYPIKPIHQIVTYLEKNVGKSFISYDEDYTRDWWRHAVSRYQEYHFTDFSFKGRYIVQAVINKIMPKRKFPLPMKMYGSSISSWWTLQADCAKYLVDFAKKETKLIKFMELTWGADEFFYATILMNSPLKDSIVNDNLRLITWEDGLANPLILKLKDFKLIKDSRKLFARKFDIKVDLDILKEVDEKLLNAKSE